jgi:hypothetical protein
MSLKFAGVKLSIVLVCFDLKWNVPVAALKIDTSSSSEMLIPLYKANGITFQRNLNQLA